MPSSVGHALAGLAVSRLFGEQNNWLYVLLATSADLDIAAAALRHRPVDYGRRRSHSIGGALAVGAASGGAAWLAGGAFVSSAAKGATAYATHLALDYFGKEADEGLPLFWPFSSRTFAAERPIFRTIYSSRDHFIRGLLTRRNLRRILREIAIVAPAVVMTDLVRRSGRLLIR